MTAWTQRPEDEHRLLDSVLRHLLRFDALPDARARRASWRRPVRGCRSSSGCRRPRTAGSRTCGRRSGGELKPSIDVVVDAPVLTTRSARTVGPPVRGRPAPRPRRPRRRTRRRRRAPARRRRPRRAAAGTAAAREGRVPARRSTVPRRVDPSTAHLLGRLAVVEERVRLLVARRRARRPAARRPVPRALPERRDGRPAARRAAAGARCRASSAARTADVRGGRRRRPRPLGERLRLRELARDFALEPLDVELLLVALALRGRLPVRAAVRLPQRRRHPAAAVGGGRARAVRRAARVGRTAGTASSTGRSSPSGLLELEEPDRPLPGPPAAGAGPRGRSPARRRRPRPRRSTASWSRSTRCSWGDPARLAERARAAVRGSSTCGSRRRARGGCWPCGRCARSAGTRARARRVGARREPRPAGLGADRRAGGAPDPVAGWSWAGSRASSSARAPCARLVGAQVPVLVVGRRTWDPAWSDWPPLLFDVPATHRRGARRELWRALARERGTSRTPPPRPPRSGCGPSR